ncbi:MAG: hypothetical protein ACR2PR_08125 [Pseudohongiellaceae bacterium]
MVHNNNPDQDELLPMPAADDIPTLEKVLEIEREIKTRRHFYPIWIHKHKISKANADRRILIMEAILADYNQRMADEAGPMPKPED